VGYKVAVLNTGEGGIAQLVERLNGIQEVRGSNPLTSTSRQRHRERFETVVKPGSVESGLFVSTARELV
jgi:hypothetical protein